MAVCLEVSADAVAFLQAAAAAGVTVTGRADLAIVALGAALAAVAGIRLQISAGAAALGQPPTAGHGTGTSTAELTFIACEIAFATVAWIHVEIPTRAVAVGESGSTEGRADAFATYLPFAALYVASATVVRVMERFDAPVPTPKLICGTRVVVPSTSPQKERQHGNSNNSMKSQHFPATFLHARRRMGQCATLIRGIF